MINIYTQTNGTIRRNDFPHTGQLPPDTVWIDMLSPTQEEEKAVESALHIDAPTREEMQEIEPSSRIYQEADASYLTITVTTKADTPSPESAVVTFIRTPRLLVTKRFAEPQAIKTFISRASRQAAMVNNGDAALTGLLDAVIDRAADILERVGGELDSLSKGIFSARQIKSTGASADLEEVLRRLGRTEDLTSKVQESLLSIGRVVTFLSQTTGEAKVTKDQRTRVKTLYRDAHSLSEHAGFLAHKSNFLLDATLGLINIEQTAIIKIFSVAAVVFLPPTLVASIYGMNFEWIPELHWRFGYFWGLALMVGSAVLPYWFFKRRGWL